MYRADAIKIEIEDPMPYTIPTADDFFTRFAIFAAADPTLITSLLNEAAATIDTSWGVGDYQPAILYLAAHLYATDNSLAGDDVVVGPPGAAVIAQESFGGISVGYNTRPQPPSGQSPISEQYGSTVYGRRFLALLRKNAVSVVTV